MSFWHRYEVESAIEGPGDAVAGELGLNASIHSENKLGVEDGNQLATNLAPVFGLCFSIAIQFPVVPLSSLLPA